MAFSRRPLWEGLIKPIPVHIFRSSAVLFLTAAAVALLGCVDLVGPPPVEHATSFESDSAGWAGTRAEVFESSNCAGWAKRSQDLARSGQWAFKLYLDNDCDSGRVGIKKRFAVAPHTHYSIRVRYQLATADWGDLNHWALLAGANNEDIRFRNEYRVGSAENGRDSDVGFVWLEKEHLLSVRSDRNGEIFIALGVWGTYEVTRSYYIDEVAIRLEAR